MSFSRASLVLLVAACGGDPPRVARDRRSPATTTGEDGSGARRLERRAAAGAPPASSAPATMASSAPTGDPPDQSLGGPQEATLESGRAHSSPIACMLQESARHRSKGGQRRIRHRSAEDGKVSAARFVKKEASPTISSTASTSAVRGERSPDRKSQVVLFTFATRRADQKRRRLPRRPPPPTVVPTRAPDTEPLPCRNTAALRRLAFSSFLVSTALACGSNRPLRRRSGRTSGSRS